MPDSPYFIVQPDADRAREAAETLFGEVAFELGRILPSTADVRHVGATAVSGCLTKGDLDIVVRVPAEDFADAERILTARYARNSGSSWTDTFASFEDPGTAPHLGIQLAVVGGPEDFFHLFSDALSNNPWLLADYNALKCAFDGKPMDDYRAAKGAFVTKVLSAQHPPA